ncbi:hypothetical protein MSKU9_3321 [Komagataeibacter diospyri]|uniref:Uncharacterized protein n=1 Tax=Komagataeibacter diospyri TaxID=1932662 RepID=A0A4P5NTS3_9PROT|nr:hypothetical protein MSKU9_3321 [Komagataeibacter diospyri]
MTVVPTAMVADWLDGVNDVRVTVPVAAVPDSRDRPKSSTKLSTSDPMEVASRVRDRICSAMNWNHSPSPATASSMARPGEPTSRSSSEGHAPCAAATMLPSVVLKDWKVMAKTASRKRLI